MIRVLVAGATGALGQHVVRELDSRGLTVRALCRVRERAASLPIRTEIALGDALRPRTLGGVLSDVDVVFSCLGQSLSPRRLGFRAPGYFDVDVPANLTLLRRAVRAGVRRFIYVSACQASRFPDIDYLAAHAQVAQAVRESGLEYGILEPAPFFSQFHALVHQARDRRLMQFGPSTARTNPIAEEDLAFVCADLVESARSHVVPVGGPEIFTRREILEEACAAARVPARVQRMPTWVLDTGGWACRAFAPRLAQLAEYHSLQCREDFIAPPRGARRLSEYLRDLPAI
ncbi:MAG: NAD(P)H-binding protein [Bryobacteraceae bacterium]|nr:NAD(P)H-binding protein [Bryobacteraceae bacterium]